MRDTILTRCLLAYLRPRSTGYRNRVHMVLWTSLYQSKKVQEIYFPKTRQKTKRLFLHQHMHMKLPSPHHRAFHPLRNRRIRRLAGMKWKFLINASAKESERTCRSSGSQPSSSRMASPGSSPSMHQEDGSGISPYASFICIEAIYETKN